MLCSQMIANENPPVVAVPAPSFARIFDPSPIAKRKSRVLCGLRTLVGFLGRKIAHNPLRLNGLRTLAKTTAGGPTKNAYHISRSSFDSLFFLPTPFEVGFNQSAPR